MLDIGESYLRQKEFGQATLLYSCQLGTTLS